MGIRLIAVVVAVADSALVGRSVDAGTAGRSIATSCYGRLSGHTARLSMT